MRSAEHLHIDAWTTITCRAAEQGGLVSRADLVAAGVSKHLLEEWVQKGRLTKVAPRVWQIVGSPDSWDRRLWVGVLSLGRGTCVSHDTAAQLHGFDRTPKDRVEFTVPRAKRHSRIHGRVHSTRYLPAIDVCRIGGIPTTSATRTIIDLGRARVSRVRLEAAIDSAIRSGASAPVVLSRNGWPSSVGQAVGDVVWSTT